MIAFIDENREKYEKARAAEKEAEVEQEAKRER